MIRCTIYRQKLNDTTSDYFFFYREVCNFLRLFKIVIESDSELTIPVVAIVI